MLRLYWLQSHVVCVVLKGIFAAFIFTYLLHISFCLLILNLLINKHVFAYCLHFLTDVPFFDQIYSLMPQMIVVVRFLSLTLFHLSCLVLEAFEFKQLIAFYLEGVNVLFVLGDSNFYLTVAPWLYAIFLTKANYSYCKNVVLTLAFF